MVYRQHGHVPSDKEIENLGPRAFPPRRPAHVPTAEEFKRAAEDLAPGDDGEEFAAVADGLDISHLGDDDVDVPFYISAAAPTPWSLAAMMASWDQVVADMLAGWGRPGSALT